MELRNLKAFYLVAKRGGLFRAAREMGVTPAALSLRLKHLELEIDVKLFERRPNRLVLTEDGSFFLNHVQRILEDIDNSVSLIHASKGTIAGNVSVALGGDIALVLAPYIAGFVKKNPQVRLRILSCSSPDTLELVLEDKVEVGIGRFQKLPRTLKKIHLFTSSLVAIYPKGHPLTDSEQLSLRDLASHGLIVLSYNSATKRLIDQVFFKSGLTMKTVIEAGSCFAIKKYVNLGLGVGLIHRRCLFGGKEQNLKISDLTHIFGQQEVSLIYKSNRHLMPAHKRFVEALSQHGDISTLRK
ncbi:MAG: LysR family transcriptional regulator [Candidatus Binatia bacterium]